MKSDKEKADEAYREIKRLQEALNERGLEVYELRAELRKLKRWATIRKLELPEH